MEKGKVFIYDFSRAKNLEKEPGKKFRNVNQLLDAIKILKKNCLGEN